MTERTSGTTPQGRITAALHIDPTEVVVTSVGSINLDISVQVPRPPQPDETLVATSLEHHLGGKGANQAVAARRLGARTSLIGHVGTDPSAATIVERLTAESVNLTGVTAVPEPTGTAIPILTSDGEVSIIVHPGANAQLTVDDVESAAHLLTAADACVLQGEISAEASARAAQIAREGGAVVVFNPAPVPPGWQHVAAHATVIVVNAVESQMIDRADLHSHAKVVTTLGPIGAEVEGRLLPAMTAHVIDPTGAGDAFVAALAVALAAGAPLDVATTFAMAAGACAVELPGAAAAMPTLPHVQTRLRDHLEPTIRSTEATS